MHKIPKQRQAKLTTKFEALPETKQALLVELLEEMALVNKGALRMPTGKIMYVARGRGIPLPQTHPKELVRKLLASDDWRKILANEILLLLELFHRGGHPEAAPDAFQWCKKYSLDVRDWVRDAPEKAKGQGKRPLDSKWEQFRKDLIRTGAVIESADVIAAERKQPSHHRDPRHRDKYARAKEKLAGPWLKAGADTRVAGATKAEAAISEKRIELEGHLKTLHAEKKELIAEGEATKASQLDTNITSLVMQLRYLAGESKIVTTNEFSTKGIRKSYKKIIERNFHIYTDTARLMDVFQFQAPTLYKLLS
ncbi:MAG: hypothetical protein LAO19_17130 [Acidobacteriia bacterium]|nr:hypothetical protein [Terriglobia bacterium]